MKNAARYRCFREFYPFYLSQHENTTCRRLHFMGTTLVILTAWHAVATTQWSLLLGLPLWGYGFAWAGHFFFEKNRPATFTYPFYSLLGDFVMYGQILTGSLGLTEKSGTVPTSTEVGSAPSSSLAAKDPESSDGT